MDHKSRTVRKLTIVGKLLIAVWTPYVPLKVEIRWAATLVQPNCLALSCNAPILGVKKCQWREETTAQFRHGLNQPPKSDDLGISACKHKLCATTCRRT
eukprot:2333331-Amphidinium_carterae.2